MIQGTSIETKTKTLFKVREEIKDKYKTRIVRMERNREISSNKKTLSARKDTWKEEISRGIERRNKQRNREKK